MSHNRTVREQEMAEAKALNAQKRQIKRDAVIRGLRSGAPRQEIRRRAKVSEAFIEEVAAELGVKTVRRDGWLGGTPA